MNETFRTIISGTRTLSSCYHSRESELGAKYGLSGGECAVLAFLTNNPGIDSGSAIAQARHMQLANVSSAVASLVRKGLVEKRTDPDDRRVVHIVPTALAKGFQNELDALLVDLGKEIFEGFSEDEIASLVNAFNHMETNCRRMM